MLSRPGAAGAYDPIFGELVPYTTAQPAAALAAERRLPWVADLAVLFALGLALLWTIPSWTIRVGVALVAASLAIHVLGPPLASALGHGPDDALYQLKVALKEGTERGGFVAIAFGLCAAVFGRPSPR